LKSQRLCIGNGAAAVAAHANMYLVGESAAILVGSALVNLGKSAAALVGVTLVDLLLGEGAAALVGSALVDLRSPGESAAALVGGALVDLVEDEFHVGELHVDGWWVGKSVALRECQYARGHWKRRRLEVLLNECMIEVAIGEEKKL
jgi:hypothetical protein